MGSPKDAGSRRQRGRPRAFHDKTEQNTIRSLDRALDALEALARLEGATLSGLAGALGESPATIYRILVTMAAHGIVESDEATQTWHVGPNAFLIGSVFLRRTSLIERARPELRRLMEVTGETANLGVEREGAVLFVSQVETHASIRAFFPPGTKSPLHASGIGKVLLAEAAPERLAAMLAAGLARFTEHTITDPAALERDLSAIRARGYSVDNEERTEGMRCIAAPIRDAFGEVVAGISVSGPVSRVRPASVEPLSRHVVEAAGNVSAALGARPIGSGASRPNGPEPHPVNTQVGIRSL
jgi:IclR family transcriptional regulator, acetate operon repressor